MLVSLMTTVLMLLANPSASTATITQDSVLNANKTTTAVTTLSVDLEPAKLSPALPLKTAGTPVSTSATQTRVNVSNV